MIDLEKIKEAIKDVNENDPHCDIESINAVIEAAQEYAKIAPVIEQLRAARKKAQPEKWRYYPPGDNYGAHVHFGAREGGFALHKDTPLGKENAEFITLAANLIAKIGE